MLPLLSPKSDKIQVHFETRYQFAAGPRSPHSPWTIELTNSAAEHTKCLTSRRFKGYFIHQDFLTPGATEARLKLIKSSEPNVKQH